MRWCDEHDVGYIIDLAGSLQGLYDEVYCQRGDAESRIKEQQLGLFADRTSCRDFVANQFRVLLSAAAIPTRTP